MPASWAAWLGGWACHIHIDRWSAGASVALSGKHFSRSRPSTWQHGSVLIMLMETAQSNPARPGPACRRPMLTVMP